VRSQYGNQTKKDREDHQDSGRLIESGKTSSSWEYKMKNNWLKTGKHGEV